MGSPTTCLSCGEPGRRLCLLGSGRIHLTHLKIALFSSSGKSELPKAFATHRDEQIAVPGQIQSREGVRPQSQEVLSTADSFP